MIFLDTSFIISYYNEHDDNHSRALSLMNKIVSGNYGEFIISDYIFDEVATIAFIRLKNLSEVEKIGNDIQFFTNIYTIEEKVFQDSWNIFVKQYDTKMSFTDCSIIALMRSQRVKYLATFDEDFDKVEGIEILNYSDGI